MSNFSGYGVGTAGSAEVGRGLTVHLFHSSETAFYERADQLSTGLMQTVADVPGTEMIFESTANGPSGFFYDLVQGAIAGKNGFQLIFVPWYWDNGYQDKEPLDVRALNENEHEYYTAFKDDGLTLHNLAWRRRKLASFGGQEWKFCQEFPTTIEEAFIKAEGRFFDLAKVHIARKRILEPNAYSPLIVGVDQGRTGDPTIICRRQGNVIFPFESIPADDGDQRDMRLAGRLANILQVEKPSLLTIDTTNEHGALDRLHELGYSKRIVKGVHFGEQAFDKTRHRNKRVEMHFNLRDWFLGPDVSIPDDQVFVSDIGSIPFEKETSNNVAYLVSKDEIKKDLKRSPDKLDSAVLTFAFPVRRQPRDPNSRESRAVSTVKSRFRSTLRSKQGVGTRRT